jgi:hypothetical protein
VANHLIFLIVEKCYSVIILSKTSCKLVLIKLDKKKQLSASELLECRMDIVFCIDVLLITEEIQIDHRNSGYRSMYGARWKAVPAALYMGC